MTDTQLVIVVSSVQSVVLAILAALVKIYLARQEVIHKAVAETKIAMIELEKNTNSMKDALVKVTGEAAFARGHLQGTEDAQTQRSE